MSPERWQQIKTILDAAADSPAASREAILDEACGEDAGLRQDVETFLDLDDAVEDFIEEPLWSLNPGDGAEEDDTRTWGVGRRVGPYRIERPIGRGGMGTVFLAVRQDDYSQKVALKVLGWGMSSEEVLGRFYNERQILANLQHPAIARLLDGGTTDDGLPYLVMEYVEGERIDRYCECRDLPVRERLELFRQVCAAVQYAHQNLIVHRDLKASNILVNEHGKVRLLDFGIAKILESQRSFQKVATLPGHAPMTPAYASPEQVLNDPITTACDVYALGVLLYRLLTGLPPYRLEGASYPEMVQVICFREPEKPSTVVRFDMAAPEQETTEAAGPPAAAPAPPSAVSRDRRARGKKIAGDLDAIVLRAMRKEPQHRYASAAEMSEDIHRHLVGLPVAARKGNWVYHTGKFLRRNKLALAAIVLILAFAVTATFLWRQAVRQRAVAEREWERAEIQEARAVRVTEFLEDLFKAADPDATQGQGAEVSVLEILETGRRQILGELYDVPEVRAEILGSLANVYSNLGRFEDVAELREEALRIRRESNPGDRAELATDINNLAGLHYRTGHYAEAERYYREALAMWQRLGEPQSEIALTMNNFASTLLRLGRADEATRLYRQALEIGQESGAETVSTSLYGLGALYSERREFDKAEPFLRQALALRQREYGLKHSKVAAVCNALGRMFYAKGDLEQASSFYRRALDIRRQNLGEEHPDVANSEKNLAALLLEQGEVGSAAELLQKALTTLQRVRSQDSVAIADVRSLWGAVLTAQRRYQEAEPYLIESFETLLEYEGRDTISTEAALERLRGLYTDWGHPERFEAFQSKMEELGEESQELHEVSSKR